MKVLVSSLAVSCAFGIIEQSAFGQARGGGAVSAGPGVGASAGVGSSAVSGSTAGRASGTAAIGTPVGSTVTAPGTLGNVGAGGTVGSSISGSTTPVGPLNPGGITGIPPQTAGRTFDRSIIGGAPVTTPIDPANPQPPFRFPPASETLQPFATQNDLVEPTATAVPNSGAIAPVTVGNTVGTNFGRALTVRPQEPVAINLPPGARIATNVAGVPEVIVAAPGIVSGGGSLATNGIVPPASIIPAPSTPAVGRGPTFESSTDRSLAPGQRIAPPAGRLD